MQRHPRHRVQGRHEPVLLRRPLTGGRDGPGTLGLWAARRRPPGAAACVRGQKVPGEPTVSCAVAVTEPSTKVMVVAPSFWAVASPV